MGAGLKKVWVWLVGFHSRGGMGVEIHEIGICGWVGFGTLVPGSYRGYGLLGRHGGLFGG